MAGKSRISTVIGVRLPNEVVEIIRRRCAKNRFDSISAYLREQLIHDYMRKHGKHRNNAKRQDSKSLNE